MHGTGDECQKTNVTIVIRFWLYEGLHCRGEKKISRMERKTLKQFHRNLTWQSRIYALVVIATVIFAHFFNAWNSSWTTTIIAVVALVLFLDSFTISFHRNPRLWQLIKWGIILIVLALLLIGFSKIQP